MTCKEIILEVLREAGERGMAGGILETTVHDRSIHKASTVSRVARLMARDKIIQRGEFGGYVWYRIINT